VYTIFKLIKTSTIIGPLGQRNVCDIRFPSIFLASPLITVLDCKAPTVLYSQLSVCTLNLNSVNQLIFVMVKCSVLFEVRTEFLNII
jgi:hypothetical protein